MSHLDENEASINLDKDGRLCIDRGQIDYSIRAYDDVFNMTSDELSSVANDCKVVFNAKEVNKDDNYSIGSTFFVCANQEPKCTLEKLAKEIFNYHTQGIEFDLEKSGAEWWSQYIEEHDDIGFHWDRDYGIEDEYNMNVHPNLGTVTYFTNEGGPTIILDKSGYFDNEKDDISSTIIKSYISKPKIGKHLVFDGLFLHGASSDIFCDPTIEESSESENSNSATINPRITFLVNIWINHIPTQSETAPLELVSRLTNITCADTLCDSPSTSKLLSASLSSYGSTTRSLLQFNHPSAKEDILLHNDGAYDGVEPLQYNVWEIVVENSVFKIEVPLWRHDMLRHAMLDVTMLTVDMSEAPGRFYFDRVVEDSENSSCDDESIDEGDVTLTASSDDEQDEEKHEEKEVIHAKKKAKIL